MVEDIFKSYGQMNKKSYLSITVVSSIEMPKHELGLEIKRVL